MNLKKQLLVFILLVLLMIPFGSALADAATLTVADINEAIYNTVDYYQGEGAPTDEWVVFALNAAGEDVNKTPYLTEGKNFYDNFVLNDNTIGDYAKAILAYESIGEDSSSLVDSLAACDRPAYFYVSTAANALMALDAAGALSDDTDSINRDYLINFILDNKLEGSDAWGYVGYGEDVDTTAMAITALAPYYEDEDYPTVQSSVDVALTWMQAQDFSGNACSISQVIYALTALGIDPQTWQASNMVSDLISCQMADGQFEFYGNASDMATYQSLAALAAARDYALNETNVYLYQNITYNDRNIITIRIENGADTVLEETILQCPVSATLSEVADYIATTQGLTDIAVLEGDIFNPSTSDIYHAYITKSGEGAESGYVTGDPVIEAGDAIILYTGADTAMIGSITLTNSLGKASNPVSADDTVTITVNGEDSGGNPVLVSGATVYVDGQEVATTDESGEATFSIEDNGTYQVWVLGINGEGDTVLVKTKSKTVSVVDNVTVSFRMEGVMNADYSDGTVINEMTLEVPEGSDPLCVIKRALDEAYELDITDITNTIEPETGFIENDDIQGIYNPGYYMYSVNDIIDWGQPNLGTGDSLVLYMSCTHDSGYTAYAKIEADDYQVNAGGTVTLTVTKSDNGPAPAYTPSYVPAEGTEIYIDGERYEDDLGNPILTDVHGQVTVTLDEAKKYTFYAQDFDDEGIPQIVKTGQISVYAGLNVEFIDTPDSFSLGDDADITVKITNGQSVSVNGLAIVALYDTSSNEMVNYSYVTKTIEAGSSEQLTAGFAIPDSGNYQVRVFVWDSWGSMMPLTDCLTIDVD